VAGGGRARRNGGRASRSQTSSSPGPLRPASGGGCHAISTRRFRIFEEVGDEAGSRAHLSSWRKGAVLGAARLRRSRISSGRGMHAMRGLAELKPNSLATSHRGPPVGKHSRIRGVAPAQRDEPKAREWSSESRAPRGDAGSLRRRATDFTGEDWRRSIAPRPARLHTRPTAGYVSCWQATPQRPSVSAQPAGAPSGRGLPFRASRRCSSTPLYAGRDEEALKLSGQWRPEHSPCPDADAQAGWRRVRAKLWHVGAISTRPNASAGKQWQSHRGSYPTPERRRLRVSRGSAPTGPPAGVCDGVRRGDWTATKKRAMPSRLQPGVTSQSRRSRSEHQSKVGHCLGRSRVGRSRGSSARVRDDQVGLSTRGHMAQPPMFAVDSRSMFAFHSSAGRTHEPE
jgi:hypothetical protein